MIWFGHNYVCCVSSIMYFTIISKFARVIYADEDDGSAINGRAICTHATLPQKKHCINWSLVRAMIFRALLRKYKKVMRKICETQGKSHQ